MRNSIEKLAITISSTIVLIFCIIFSLYIYISGKSTPGGGFQAGAILSSGILLYRIFNNLTPIPYKITKSIIVCGALMFVLNGLASFIFGGTIFQYSAFHSQYGHIIGTFISETGVFLTVTASLIQIGQSLQSY